jgi:signal transduction histidine kinase
MLARFEAGLVLDLQPVSLGSVLDEAVNNARRTAAGRRVALEAEGEDSLVSGDRERLHQIFSNLLDNALRHTAKDGTIGFPEQG